MGRIISQNEPRKGCRMGRIIATNEDLRMGSRMGREFPTNEEFGPGWGHLWVE
jgi:hypothetical protein